jgi:uncharacterized protein
MLKEGRESLNIEDRRGMGGGGFALGGGGCLTLIIGLVAYFLTGNTNLLQQSQQQNQPQVEQNQPIQTNPQEEAQKKFMAVVLATTEDAWRATFQRSGVRYQEPKLVLFRGSTPTACGRGDAGMGPFYCPADQKMYLDFAFFDELRREFKAPGDFAQAYVIAHEVGHHVQNLLGTMSKVQAYQQRLPEAQSNRLSVALELQADCYAGVWANYVQKQNKLEVGDVEEAMRAAAAVGDDMIQKRTQGYVVPESFTHGSAKERMTWFNKGLQTGDARQCNTFGRSF